MVWPIMRGDPLLATNVRLCPKPSQRRRPLVADTSYPLPYAAKDRQFLACEALMRRQNNRRSADPSKREAGRFPHFCSSRREFLGSALAAGATGVLSQSARSLSNSFLSGLLAQNTTAASKATRIDLHYHVPPPALIQALGAQQFANAASNWTLDQRLMDMDRNGVVAAMCSIAPQGDPLADASKAVRLPCECNEYLARVATDRPGRVRVFA